jgi:hypothetical protein
MDSILLGPHVIFNLICDLTLNPLLFHHVVHVGIDLWIMGFQQMLHSSKDTKASIESFHRALKHCCPWRQKGFEVVGLIG